MAWRSGKGTDAKKLMIRLPEQRGDEKLYLLDSAQTKALLSVAESIAWLTRHVSLPSWIDSTDKLQAFADETMLDLMTPADFCEALVGCTDELKAILEDLLLSDSDIQNAIKNMLLNDPDFITNITNAVLPLKPETLNPETENLDLLWAQCVGIVEYSHNAINDLFDVLEVQTNNLELMQNVKLIPGVQVVTAIIPVTEAIALVDWLLGTLREQYAAQWEETPPTGTKWIIACRLFCLCKTDKVITTDRIFQAISSLLDDYLEISWNNLTELVESIVGVNDNSEVMVYSMFYFMWGTAKLAGKFGLQSLTNEVLKIIIKLNDVPSNDWEVYCTDCIEEESILLTPIGYAGLTFGIMPAMVDDGEEFLVTSTDGPAHSGDRLFAFITDKNVRLNLIATNWTFTPYTPSGALWGYCPITATDPTNLAQWIFTRESSGETTLNIPTDLECRGLWIESASGITFTASLTMEIMT